MQLLLLRFIPQLLHLHFLVWISKSFLQLRNTCRQVLNWLGQFLYLLFFSLEQFSQSAQFFPICLQFSVFLHWFHLPCPFHKFHLFLTLSLEGWRYLLFRDLEMLFQFFNKCVLLLKLLEHLVLGHCVVLSGSDGWSSHEWGFSLSQFLTKLLAFFGKADDLVRVLVFLGDDLSFELVDDIVFTLKLLVLGLAHLLKGYDGLTGCFGHLSAFSLIDLVHFYLCTFHHIV